VTSTSRRHGNNNENNATSGGAGAGGSYKHDVQSSSPSPSQACVSDVSFSERSDRSRDRSRGEHCGTSGHVTACERGDESGQGMCGTADFDPSLSDESDELSMFCDVMNSHNTFSDVIT